MTADQYWLDHPCILDCYIEAQMIKKKEQDWLCWRQGMYIYEALIDVSPVLHAFAKNGTKPLEYSEKPYSFDSRKCGENDAENDTENERLKARLFFENWVRNTRKMFDKNQKTGGGVNG